MAEEENKNYTFYICSDNISGKSKDKNRINKFVQAFKSAGYKAKNCGVGSDIHSHPDRYGCRGPNNVWVFIVGGDCICTYWDMQQSYFKKKLNGAKILIIRQFGAITTKAVNKTSLHNAWDDNFCPKSLSLRNYAKNLDAYFTKYGFSYLEGTESQIVADIKAGNIHGAGLDGFTSNGSSSSDIKIGYSNSNVFKAYLNIQYTKDKNWDNGVNKTKVSNLQAKVTKAKNNYDKAVKDKKPEKTIKNYKTKWDNAQKALDDYIKGSAPPIKEINVDFTLQAPEATTTDKITYTSGGTKKTINIPPSFNNPNIPTWLNNTIRENSFNLLQFIQEAEKDYNKQHEYYLYRVTFQSAFGKDNSGNISNDKDKKNLLYESNDLASYKMDLYDIGLFKGDIVTVKNYGSSGKKVNDVIKGVLDEVNYYPKMKYGKYRFNDRIEFIRMTEDTKPVFDFYDMEHWETVNNEKQIVDGSILNLSNVQYTPIQDTLNNSLYIFKGRYDVLRDDDTMSYFYERYCDLDRILKYGEQTMLGSDTSNTLSSTEAYNLARTNYLNNFEERRSYTIKVAGIPPVEINDFVRTHMDNPLLDSGDSGLKVSSIEWNIDPGTSPCINTTLGLGKPDKKFEIASLLTIQKQRANDKNIDVPVNVIYFGDENIDGLI